MVDPIFQSDNYQVARKLLDAAALRQEAIASNIANAETPGYRRLDLSRDFADQLRSHVRAGDLDRAAEMRPRLVEDTHARTVRPDGNTVEIENELLAMNRNSVEYEFLTEVVSRNIKQLKLAITGRSV
jgi:flagellar basal-body rod protein FlgB